MKLTIAVFCIPLMAISTSFAQQSTYHLIDTKSFDFAAPVAPSEASVTNSPVGTIIYDASTNQFKGLDSSGNWDPMTSPGGAPNVTSSSTGTERVERLSFGGAGSITSPTNCTTSPCTIYSQSGSWVTSVTRSATGVFTVNINSGEFATPPTCTCSVNKLDPGTVCSNAIIQGTSSIRLSVYSPQTSSAQDDPVNVICMGEH